MSEVATVETAETTATPVVERKPRGPSATDVQFVDAWNASNSRKEVLDRLAEAGVPMTYSAMAARHKAYVDKGANLKVIPAGKRGRKTDITKLNEHIASQAAVAAVTE